MMTLYTYNHCPYCVRAKMIFALREVPFHEEVLANDDEKTPVGLIGKKIVPVLLKEDGSAMGESLDIVRYIDAYAGRERLAETVRPELQAWLARTGEYAAQLTHPRIVRLALPEFATASARAYFIEKKSQSIGDFAENIENTAALLKRLHADLPALANLIRAPTHLNHSLGYEDILTFPVLRSLSVVKGLKYPAQVQAYAEQMAAMTGIDLFTAQAI